MCYFNNMIGITLESDQEDEAAPETPVVRSLPLLVHKFIELHFKYTTFHILLILTC